MRLTRTALAVALSYALGVHPAVAQVEAVRVVAPATPTGVVAIPQLGVAPHGSTLPGAALTKPVTTLALTLNPALSTKKLTLGTVPKVNFSPGRGERGGAPLAAAEPRVGAAERVAQIQAVANKAIAGAARAPGAAASEQAGLQFSTLTGERLIRGTGAVDPDVPITEPTPLPDSGWRVKLRRAGEAARPAAEPEPAPPSLEPAPPSRGWLSVFKDPIRNSAFWRYVTGYSIFLFGFQMYMVGLPYLISSMTANSLREHGDRRAENAELLKEVVRENRSIARIAHWVSQAFSYMLIPLFTRNSGTEGPGKWLTRSMFARAAVLALIPVLFFSTGLMSMQAAVLTLAGLIAVQSFFQGLTVTMEGASTTRLLGDKSVTTEERTKANSVLTVIAALIAIAGPLVAGQIALLGPIAGKEGVGGAVIYGIYAGTVALAGLIWAGIKLFKGPSAVQAAPGEETPQTPKGVGGVLKGLWSAIKDGTKIVLKDRLLRTMLLLSMMSSLFSDPLVFNVLPEYIEGLVKANPNSLGSVLSIPGLGWFLKTLAATPMGNFALMMVMASLGSIVATLLMKPLTKLFTRFGFKTEEALTVPFYVIAALEAPLFWLMTVTPSILAAVGLYGLQALSIGFIGIAIQGLYQRNLGARKSADINKILAANSLIGIAAAIVSTFAYGFLLKDIAIGTSLLIAAIATGVVAAIRLAAPFLAFTKEQRKPADPPPQEPRSPRGHAMPSTGDHNGPNSIFSTHL
ncbi:MAG: hypothetical protein HY553_00355 [Elusimicrobia bacterium]|nr:hypothetical protein [Elusimicrobiota bacterium]